MKLEFSGQIFERCSNIQFYQNPSSGIRVAPCGRTDRRTDGRTDGRTDTTKLIVAFRNFGKAPKTNKKYKLKLKYNNSIIKDFSSKTPSTCPTQGSLGQIRPTYYFSKKKKTEGDNNNTSSFSVYSSSKELPNRERF